jgi:ribosome-associated toxin RatA of RatAB toxin-antitoxin module
MNSRKLNNDHKLAENIEVNIKWKKKQQTCFSTSIVIPFSIEKVWNILADYESHPKFVPGLIETHKLQNLSKSLQIKQVYRQLFLGIKFDSYCILDIVENYPYSISSKLVEGDFKILSGCYELESIDLDSKPKTILTYSLLISPKFVLPRSLFEKNMR